jgi:hypothetical protein
MLSKAMQSKFKSFSDLFFSKFYCGYFKVLECFVVGYVRNMSLLMKLVLLLCKYTLCLKHVNILLRNKIKK